MNTVIQEKHKTKNTPYGIGKRFGSRELELLKEALDSDNLFYHNGAKSKSLCELAKNYFGVPYAALASSGTGAIHAAVASLQIEPGYEVITSPITDYGTLIGLLYQNLIPVFADVDPHTYNITADSIRSKITDRTRAVIVVHLAGNPCEMNEILELTRPKNIPVIEDCAQSYDAFYRGKKAGTFGDFGCYSLNAFKHISTGDGGFVLTSSEDLYYKVHNYLDKSYDRFNRGGRISALAPCYRMSELQSACAIGQLEKLPSITSRRNKLGDKLTRLISGIPGIHPHQVHEENRSSYWFYMLRIELPAFSLDRDGIVLALQKEGIQASAGYIPRPIYLEKVFIDKSFFPGVWPAELIAQKTYTYCEGLCPVAEEVLRTAIRLPINEFFTDQDIEETAEAIRKVAEAARK